MEARAMVPEERRAVGAVLTRAFDDDPGFRHVLPGAFTRRRALPPVFRQAARDAAAHGHADVLADRTGVTGVSLWFEPGGYPPDPERLRRAVGSQLLAALWAPTRLAVGSRVIDLMHRHFPGMPVVYLATLAVDPRAQGTGIGSRLVTSMLEQSAGLGVPTYLETAKRDNVPWYRRFGFVEREELRLPDDGPPIWTMLRPAGP